LRAERPERVDRLRHETDMTHHRDSALGQERDGFTHPHASLELHGPASRLLHDARRIGKRLLARCLIGAERHVDHDQRALAAADDRLTLEDHHVQRDRHGGAETVHHHAKGVADQQEVAVLVEQACRVSVIRGQRHDRLAALPGADIRRRRTLDLLLNGHAHPENAGTPTTYGWNQKPSAR
jgi:hypothetical protein